MANEMRSESPMLRLAVIPFGYVGRGFFIAVHTFLRISGLLIDTFDWILVKPLRGRGLRIKDAVWQFVHVGYYSLPIVALICLLMGGILAMQSAYQLRAFGVMYLVPDLVAVAALRELSPLMVAILITGRSGSAFAAEIGTMKVSEEIDALKVMGLNETKYLVVPKFLGTLASVPMVTLVASFVMMLGGYLISVTYIGQDSDLYLQRTMDAIAWTDFINGMVKSVFFAMTICWVGVYRGFQTEGGAAGVGKMTTSSVVTAIFMIVLVDVIFTYLFFSP